MEVFFRFVSTKIQSPEILARFAVLMQFSAALQPEARIWVPKRPISSQRLAACTRQRPAQRHLWFFPMVQPVIRPMALTLSLLPANGITYIEGGLTMIRNPFWNISPWSPWSPWRPWRPPCCPPRPPGPPPRPPGPPGPRPPGPPGPWRY